jgi:hypothetical protein
MENGKNKAVLIDIKKAFDSVVWIVLEDNITNLLGREGQILIIFLAIYKALILKIAGGEIEPEKGSPQCTVFGPILFCIYINDLIINLSNTRSSIITQAYMDDLILQDNNMDTLQDGLNNLFPQLLEINLEINQNKSELISDNNEDVLQIPASHGYIPTKAITKYLGQYLNSEGYPTIAITSGIFGKINSILFSANGLMIRTRIRLFHTYMISKVNHLLPSIALTKGLPNMENNQKSNLPQGYSQKDDNS